MALASDPVTVREMVEAEGLRYPVYIAGDDVGQAMQVRQFPSTYVVDTEGRIVARDAGWSPAWRLRQLLQ